MEKYSCGKNPNSHKPTEQSNIKRSIASKTNPNVIKTQLKKGDIREKSIAWKGENIGYYGLHHWVVKELGKTKFCNNCGKNTGKTEWANKSHEYKRDVNDWISLCVKCHRQYDKCREDICKYYDMKDNRNKLIIQQCKEVP